MTTVEKKNPLLKRFPSWNEIIPVYSVGVAILFSWDIIKALQTYIINWSLQFKFFEILSLFAYVIFGAFLESLILISSFLIFSFILPRKLFGDKFIMRATILSITFLGAIIYLYSLTMTFDILLYFKRWCEVFLSSFILLILVGEAIHNVRKFFEELAERCTVFLYIYIPLSILAMLIVLARNIG